MHTSALSHVPPAHAAVQVVIPETPTVFFGVPVAHPPVAKRVVVADKQVYVGPALELKVASASSMAVQAVHTPESSHLPGLQVAATLFESDVQVTVAASVTGVQAAHAAVPEAYVPAGQVVEV